MARVLVVEDSATDRRIVAEMLGSDPDLEIESAGGARKALQRMASFPPDVVLTDLVMPEMDGFELVAAVRERFPSVPVVLMTSRGNEEIAVRALKQGATSYVSKRRLATDLLATIREVLDLSSRRRTEARALEALTECDLGFRLENREELVLPLVKQLQGFAGMLGPLDEAEWTQIGVALCEALMNAIEHGNLEVAAELRGTDIAAHARLMRERCDIPPYRDRRVRVRVHLDREEARFVIRDEGPGFDPRSLPDPRAPENLERHHGRGVLLILSFMDEVTWNERGNEITMVKRRRPRPDQ